MSKRGDGAGVRGWPVRRSSFALSAIFPLLLMLGYALSGCATTSIREGELRCPTTFDNALGRDEVSLRWFGTAGYEIRYRDTVVLIDPFLTRPELAQTVLWNAPLASDEAAIDRHIDRADYIFISHSHYDHLMDAPHIAIKTGATIFGSKTTCMIAQSLGVDAPQSRCVASGDVIDAGPMRVTVVGSRHAKMFGAVHNDGRHDEPLAEPLRERHYKLGSIFGFLIEVAGVKIYHHGSADLIDANLESLVGRVDVLILGIAGWQNTPAYVPRMLSVTQPGLLIPTHHDAFFLPYDDGVVLLGGVGFDAFVGQVRGHRPDTRILTLDFFQEYRHPVSRSPSQVAQTPDPAAAEKHRRPVPDA